MRSFYLASLVITLLCAANFPANALPYAVFIVHCEPQNADGESFLSLRDLVAKADAHQVKLTIDFTPQWAEMILANPVFLEWTGQWQQTGHEIAVHHHPYGVSKLRAARWDGYTNIDPSSMPPGDQADYLGDMVDYLALLNTLPGIRTSWTLGLGEEIDKGDWPEGLSYSARGHAIEDAISRPELVQYGDAIVSEMTHALFWNRGAPEWMNVYASADSGDIFALLTHVSNYEESLAAALAVEDFFALLAAQDPSAASFRWR